MEGRSPLGGHSADVSLTLRVGGCVFPAAACSDQWVKLRQTASLPDGPAELIATIDGHDEHWCVEIDERHVPRELIPIRIIAHASINYDRNAVTGDRHWAGDVWSQV